jgi:hypothetical protein
MENLMIPFHAQSNSSCLIKVPSMKPFHTFGETKQKDGPSLSTAVTLKLEKAYLGHFYSFENLALFEKVHACG